MELQNEKQAKILKTDEKILLFFKKNAVIPRGSWQLRGHRIVCLFICLVFLKVSGCALVARTGTTTFAGGIVTKIIINPIVERAFFQKEYVVTCCTWTTRRGLFSQRLRGDLLEAYGYIEGDLERGQSQSLHGKRQEIQHKQTVAF